jgi:hypothetical protein
MDSWCTTFSIKLGRFLLAAIGEPSSWVLAAAMRKPSSWVLDQQRNRAAASSRSGLMVEDTWLDCRNKMSVRAIASQAFLHLFVRPTLARCKANLGVHHRQYQSQVIDLHTKTGDCPSSCKSSLRTRLWKRWKKLLQGKQDRLRSPALLVHGGEYGND